MLKWQLFSVFAYLGTFWITHLLFYWRAYRVREVVSVFWASSVIMRARNVSGISMWMMSDTLKMNNIVPRVLSLSLDGTGYHVSQIISLIIVSKVYIIMRGSWWLHSLKGRTFRNNKRFSDFHLIFPSLHIWLWLGFLFHLCFPWLHFLLPKALLREIAAMFWQKL